MARWYEAANESSFKPIAEGHVFQAPSPWMLARPRYYTVTDAQKADILVVLGRWRLMLIVCVLIDFAVIGALVAFVKLSPGTFIRLVGPVLALGPVPFAVLLFAALLAVMVPLLAVPQIVLHRGLRAPLASAPRTDQRMTMAEQLPNIAGAMSGKALTLWLTVGLFLLGISFMVLIEAYAEGHFVRSLLFPFLPFFAMSALLTGYFGYLFRLRTKSKNAVA